jgi:hypothetical protein
MVWNRSYKDSPNEGHLSVKDTVLVGADTAPYMKDTPKSM